MKIDNKDFTIYYSNECPYVEYSVKELSEYAKENNIKINFIKIDTLEKAKNVPCIFNNCKIKDQEAVIHKYNLCRKIVRCFLATFASLLLLKINMLYLMVILFVLCLMYLCLTIKLFRNL